MTKCIGATAIAMLLLASPAMAQGVSPQWAQPPQWARPQTTPYMPTYQAPQPQQMPQSWTGNQVGNSTFWSGSNGGSVTCNRVGTFTFCN
jgi:hypothetical protein